MKKDYKHEMEYHDDWKKLSGPLPVRMTSDFLFRALLQTDEKTLKALIASVLHLKYEDIVDVLITNPIELGGSIYAKELHLDVSVKLGSGEKLDVEMQAQRYAGWTDRTLVYLCRSFDQLNHGKKYEETQRAIQISFTDFSLFEDKPEFFSTYMLINTNSPEKVYSDKLAIINIDLKSIELATEEDRRFGVDRWARIFKATTWEELKMIATTDKSADRATSSKWELTDEDIMRERRLWQEDNEREYNYTVQRAKQADELEKELAENKKEIAENKKEIAEKDKELAEKDKELADTKETARIKDNRIMELEKMVLELNAKLDEKK